MTVAAMVVVAVQLTVIAVEVVVPRVGTATGRTRPVVAVRAGVVEATIRVAVAAELRSSNNNR